MLQPNPFCGVAEVFCAHHPFLRVLAVGGNNRGLPIRLGQQDVDTIVCTGVISLVMGVVVVEAGAGKRSLVHKHRAVTSVCPGATQWRVLLEKENATVTFQAER